MAWWGPPFVVSNTVGNTLARSKWVLVRVSSVSSDLG